MEVTAAEIRGWSKVDFAARDYPAPTGSDADPLNVLIERTVADLRFATGVVIANVDADADPPDWRIPVIQEVVQILVEWRAGAYQDENAETETDFDLIASFGAGSYNETRRSPGSSRGLLHPVPRVNRLLTALATGSPTGILGDVPSLNTDDPNWDVGKDIIDAKRGAVITPFGPYRSPWDIGGTL